jgi:hypothetical protein
MAAVRVLCEVACARARSAVGFVMPSIAVWIAS